jgi:hypothetical protein
MGEQVANNRAMHGTIQLFENEAGEYYPVVDWDSEPKLIRGEYIPIGNRIQFPKKLGRKWGAQKLLESIIIDKKKQIEDAQAEIVKLTACLDKVSEWNDND